MTGLYLGGLNPVLASNIRKSCICKNIPFQPLLCYKAGRKLCVLLCVGGEWRPVYTVPCPQCGAKVGGKCFSLKRCPWHIKNAGINI
jgi:hypothetical protein